MEAKNESGLRDALLSLVKEVMGKVVSGKTDAARLGHALAAAYNSGVSFLVKRDEKGAVCYDTAKNEAGQEVRSVAYVPVPYNYGRDFLRSLREVVDANGLALMAKIDKARLASILSDAARYAATECGIKEWAPKAVPVEGRETFTKKTSTIVAAEKFLSWYSNRGGDMALLVRAIEARTAKAKAA
jgi:hypothetical protein